MLYKPVNNWVNVGRVFARDHETTNFPVSNWLQSPARCNIISTTITHTFHQLHTNVRYPIPRNNSFNKKWYLKGLLNSNKKFKKLDFKQHILNIKRFPSLFLDCNPKYISMATMFSFLWWISSDNKSHIVPGITENSLFWYRETVLSPY